MSIVSKLFCESTPRSVSDIVADIQEKVNEFDTRIAYDQEQIDKVGMDKTEAEIEFNKKVKELNDKAESHKTSMEWAARVKSRMSDFIA